MDVPFRPLNIDRDTLHHLQDLAWVQRELAAGKQVGELLKFAPEAITVLYGRAYKLFQQQHYEEALSAFLFLVFVERRQCDLWLGLGMTLQMVHRYEAAIDAYELAATCEIENPAPYFYLAKCLFATHDHQAALEALEMAIDYAKDDERYGQLLQQAQVAKQSLLRRR